MFYFKKLLFFLLLTHVFAYNILSYTISYLNTIIALYIKLLVCYFDNVKL